MRIGVDFDNTLIDYRALFHSLAAARSWIPAEFPADKEAIRARLIEEDGNDLRWQRLQAEAYGPRILEAEPFPGALEFLERASAAGHETWIVSHKTETSNLDHRIDLREAARAWARGRGLDPGRVIFASSRQEKLARIGELGIELFIDDLAEVLLEPAFPKSAVPVWFTQGERKTHPTLLAMPDWASAARLLEVAAETDPSALPALRKSLGGAPDGARALRRSGNNRVVLVTGPAGRRCVVKRAVPEPRSPRDRSLTEFRAVTLMWEQGIRSVPEPLFHDAGRGIALYSFAPGRALSGPEIQPAHVESAAEFLLRLRDVSRREAAAGFGEAADSRRRLADYLEVVERRLTRISSGLSAAPLGPEIGALLQSRALPLWRELRSRFEAEARTRRWSLEAELPADARMLSPSDFGFHNCMVDDSGRAVFLDFEYFGWDDPAKLISDFFHSVAHEVPWALKWELLDRFAAGLGDPEPFLARWEAVVDLIGFEWILIVLNVAVPEVLERRLFADPGADPLSLVRGRLERASRMLDAIEARPRGGRFRTLPERGCE
jgi:hypothetical protein